MNDHEPQPSVLGAGGGLRKLFLLFGASHLLAGASVLALASLVGGAPLVSWLTFLILGGWSAAIGLLLALGLKRQLDQAERYLERMGRAGPRGEEAPRWWALGGLIGQLDALRQRIAAYHQREQELSEYRSQLIRQVQHTTAQEERNRLARDLHDSIKQQLFSINASATAALARWERDAAGARRAVADVKERTTEAQVEMHALLQQLRPVALETVGLLEALRDQCQALGYRTGAQVTTEFGELPPDDQLPLGAQEMVFRIAQEALSNIARHARARHVALRLQQADAALIFAIRDDGQGFDPARVAGGMGLANMHHRMLALGGALEISSAPGAGATVTMRIPLAQPAEQRAAEAVDAEHAALLALSRSAAYGNLAVVAAAIGPLILVLFLGLPTIFTVLSGDFFDLLYKNIMPSILRGVFQYLGPLAGLAALLGLVRQESLLIKLQASDAPLARVLELHMRRLALLARIGLAAWSAALLAVVAFISSNGRPAPALLVTLVLGAPALLELARYALLTARTFRQLAGEQRRQALQQAIVWLIVFTAGSLMALMPALLAAFAAAPFANPLVWPASLILIVLLGILCPLWAQLIHLHQVKQDQGERQ